MKTLYIIGAVVGTIAVGAAGYGAYRMIRARTIAEQNRRMDGPTPDRASPEQRQQEPAVNRAPLLPVGYRRATPRVDSPVNQPVGQQPQQQPQQQLQSAETSDNANPPSRNLRINILSLR